MSQSTTRPLTKGLIPAYRHIHDLHRLSHLEGNGNYTLVYLVDSLTPLLVSKTLKYFEQQLPDFVRLSKSILINPRFVRSVVRKSSKLLCIKLNTGLKFSVSRRRISQVFHQLMNVG